MPATDEDVRVDYCDVPNQLHQLGVAITQTTTDGDGPQIGRDRVLWGVCRLNKMITPSDGFWELVNDILILREELETAYSLERNLRSVAHILDSPQQS